LAEGPDAEFFDRRPAIASFRSGQFDFTLVTAHLWYGEKANNPRRRNEAAALARIASSLAESSTEKDVIVLGDFNEMRAGGNLQIFETMGWTRLNREPTNLGSSEAFDNLLIDPKYTREYTGQSGVVRFDETIFGNDDKRALEQVSDHRPVWADFSTVGPDDD
jgi:endonuclease/exonuclease/phosphatase family metal-dependent hydrolase